MIRIFKRIKQKSTLDLSNQLLFATSSVVSKIRGLRPETCIQVDIDRLCLKNNLVMMLEIRFSCYSASYQSMRAGFELHKGQAQLYRPAVTTQAGGSQGHDGQFS